MGVEMQEEECWTRSLSVTRKPRENNKLASQILDPRFFRDFLSFCQLLADGFSNTECGFVAADEVEGAARIWADRANLSPSGSLEKNLFTILDAYALEFRGWVPSPDASIEIFEIPEDEDEENLQAG
jgi:hypothetical protein